MEQILLTPEEIEGLTAMILPDYRIKEGAKAQLRKTVEWLKLGAVIGDNGVVRFHPRKWQALLKEAGL